MPRLPTPGSDADNWGALLNKFLQVGHRDDGALSGIYTVANVLDFGAGSDDGANDTQAIINAIASLTEGGVVFFPPGRYKLLSTIDIPNHSIDTPNYYGITLQGSGPFATILDNYSDGPALKSATGGTIEVSMTVADLGITGQNNSGEGIHLEYTYFSHLRNLFIRNCRNGVYVSKGFYNTFDHVICYENNETGFKIGAIGNGNTFLGCTSKMNKSHGFHFTSEGAADKLHGCTVYGGVVEGNLVHQFLMEDASSIRISGVYMENYNGLPLVKITNQSNYCTISECNLDCSGTAIEIEQSRGGYIAGCTIDADIEIKESAEDCIIGPNPLIAGVVKDKGKDTIVGTLINQGPVSRRINVFSYVYPNTDPVGTEGNPRTIHIKTPDTFRNGEMWRHDLTGYAYAIAQPLSFMWMGYLYAGATLAQPILNGAALNHEQNSIPVAQYLGTDNHLYLKFGPLNRYFFSFSLDYQSGATGEQVLHSPSGFQVLEREDDGNF